MIEYFNNIDTTVFLWLNGFHNSFFDSLMYLISNKWVWVPMYATILIVNILHSGWRKKLFLIVAMFVIAFAITDFTCGNLIRNLIERPRPSNIESGISHLVHTVNGYTGGRFGFPSCHASNSFMLAVLCTLLFRNKRLSMFLFGWAVIHSYSRIYLGVHYPGDLLVGGMVGSLIAIGCYSVFEKYCNLSTTREYKYLYIISYTGIAILAFLLLFVWLAKCYMQTCAISWL